MVLAKFLHIVSFSSEDAKYPADNLLALESYKKWKCKDPGSKHEYVIIQLEKASKIHSLEIGNENSAFIEAHVCRSGDASANDFKALLPASSFMTPIESRNDSQTNRVRIFGHEKLCKPVSEEKWDRLKFTCMQPFNKHVQYGLSFIRVNVFSDSSDKNGHTSLSMGGFTLKSDALKDTIKVGSYFEKKGKEVPTNNIVEAKPIPKSENIIKLRNIYEEKKRLSNSLQHSQSQNASVSDTIPQTCITVKRGNKDSNGERMRLNNETSRDESCPKKPKLSTSSLLDTEVSKDKPLPRKHCPFSQLMSDVVFCISGFENPLRSNIRQKALSMGAAYRANWCPGCTHLICAFSNTPKYNQVKGKGKIVTKNWIEDSYKDKICYSWKKYSFEKIAVSGTEEEVYADEHPLICSSDAGPSGLQSQYDEDTDEEVERILNENGNDLCEEENRDDYPPNNLPDLPDVLCNKTLFIDPKLDEHTKQTLHRLIYALNGTESKDVEDSCISIIISNKLRKLFEKVDAKLVSIVSPEWLLKCAEENEYIDPTDYLITV